VASRPLAELIERANSNQGGKQARNKAVVAVARKLAVLLHRIWITQEPYMPFYAKAA
jgi:transposase